MLLLKSSLYTAVSILFLSFVPADFHHTATNPSDTLSTDVCQINNTVFQAGEELTYQLYYNWNFVWLKAGEVTFKVRETGDLYHLSAHGRTYESYEWFYKVRDYYDCYVDPNTLQPKLSIRDVHEGDYTKYDRIEYDHAGGKVVSNRGKTVQEAKPTQFSIGNCVHDVLSIIYYTRNLNFEDFALGQKVDVNVFMDEETHPLQVEYLGKESNKKIKKSGKYDTMVFSPEVLSGRIFKDKDKMKVWVTDDDNRMPVLIESPVSVGSIKAVLVDHDGLMHKMTAKR